MTQDPQRKTRWGISQFLKQYRSKETRNSYRQALKAFFKLLYPELRNLEGDELKHELDEHSLNYFNENGDSRRAGSTKPTGYTLGQSSLFGGTILRI